MKVTAFERLYGIEIQLEESFVDSKGVKRWIQDAVNTINGNPLRILTSNGFDPKQVAYIHPNEKPGTFWISNKPGMDTSADAISVKKS